MKQYFMPFPFLVLVLGTIAVNISSATSGKMPTTLVVFMSIIYFILWLVMIGFSLKKYYSVMLIVFGVFWALSGIMLMCTLLAELLSSSMPHIFEIGDMFFYVPIYGFLDLCNELLLRAIAAGVSWILAFVCFIGSSRSKDSLSRKQLKELMNQ